MASVVQRRLGTILAADIVGYGAYGGEVDAQAALKAHREAIDPVLVREGGRFVKSDSVGLLVEFPGALHAARASLGVQRLMAERNAGLPDEQRFAIRMGIHCGDVVVEDHDISGDGISLAERLQEVAEPGGVCLSDAAHAALHEDIDRLFPDSGVRTLRGIATPLQVYSLAGALPEPTMMAPRRLLSLMVLPFVNLTGEARHDFLADSITDQLTVELARIADSFVVDRKSASVYRGSDAPTVTELGPLLGIRYVVKGSVWAVSDGLRVNVELIDAANGQNVWRESFDIDIGDPFVMQHDLNARLVPPLYTNLLTASGHNPRSPAASDADREPPRSAQILPLVVRPPAATVRLAAPPPRPEPPAPAPLQEQPAQAASPQLFLRLRSSEGGDVQSAPVPPMVIHPRLFLAPTSPAQPIRVISSQSISNPSRTSRRYRPLGEMPTPLTSDAGEPRVPFFWKVVFSLVFAAVGGGIAVALRGLRPDAVVETASWAATAAGVFLLACAIVDWSQPRAARLPARQTVPDDAVPAGRISIRPIDSSAPVVSGFAVANRAARSRARVVVTDVFRSRSDIFDSRRRVPRR